MYKILYAVLLVMSILLFSVMYWSLHSVKSFVDIHKVWEDNLQDSLIIMQMRGAEYRNNIKSLLFNDYSSKDKACFIENGRTISISTINNDERIFIRISELDCWSCIKEISEQVNKREYLDAVFLLTASSDRNKRELIKYAKIKKPVYMVERLPFENAEKEGMPYIFRLNGEKAEKIVFPIHGDIKFYNIILTH